MSSKYKMCGGGVERQSFGMCSDLSCYQLKTDCSLPRMAYVILMVTTRKKLTVNTQKKMRKESKYSTEESHQNIREMRKEKERNREEL